MEAKWINYEDQQPEDNRLFIVRKVGTELNTNWTLKVRNKGVFESACRGKKIKATEVEYLYIS